MNTYRNRPMPFQACQWSALGDHPLVGCCLSGGMCVRCKLPFTQHGFLSAPGVRLLVCPSNFVTERQGPEGIEYDVVTQEAFDRLYEPATEETHP